MKQLTSNQQLIDKDIMRYKKNNLASNLAILSLVFECLYFLLMYGQVCGNRQEVFGSGPLADTTVYSMMSGFSVILNLAILLIVFYASVQLKSYNKTYSYVVWVVALIQILRIFYYPIQTYNSLLSTTQERIFGTGTMIYFIVWLVLSAACLIASGVVGLIRTTRLEKFNKEVPVGSDELETAYKEGGGLGEVA